jgi:hypothetical protein
MVGTGEAEIKVQSKVTTTASKCFCIGDVDERGLLQLESDTPVRLDPLYMF